MIAFLRGNLQEKSPNRLVIDVNGVGYEVNVPLSPFSSRGTLNLVAPFIPLVKSHGFSDPPNSRPRPSR